MRHNCWLVAQEGGGRVLDPPSSHSHASGSPPLHARPSHSPELASSVEKMTGQPHTKRTIDDVKMWFGRADFNKE